MEIQGLIIINSCWEVGNNCSTNDDCCTKKCLYVNDRAQAMCVLEIENPSDFSKSSPLVYAISFGITCNEDKDCIYPERCVFRSEKTGNFCSRVIRNYPVIPTTPKTCVIPGLYCEKDDDCCSKNCHRFFNTSITYCLSNDPPLCKLTGAECSRNLDCCSANCDNYTIATSVRTCLPKANGFSITTPLSIDIPPFCIKSGSTCKSNDECCSGLCSFPPHSKLLVCLDHL